MDYQKMVHRVRVETTIGNAQRLMGLFFFCDEELGNRKETAAVLSHTTYKKMTKSHPQFIEQLQERGLTSIIVAGGVHDPSAFTCSSWKSTYKSEDKNVGVVTKKRPLIQMHDFKPGTGTEVAAETAAARIAYVATSGGNLKLHINKEGIKYATLSYWDTAVLLLKV